MCCCSIAYLSQLLLDLAELGQLLLAALLPGARLEHLVGAAYTTEVMHVKLRFHLPFSDATCRVDFSLSKKMGTMGIYRGDELAIDVHSGPAGC